MVVERERRARIGPTSLPDSPHSLGNGDTHLSHKYLCVDAFLDLGRGCYLNEQLNGFNQIAAGFLY